VVCARNRISWLIAAVLVGSTGAAPARGNYLGVPDGLGPRPGFPAAGESPTAWFLRGTDEGWVPYRAEFAEATPWLMALVPFPTILNFGDDRGRFGSHASLGSPSQTPGNQKADADVVRHLRSPTYRPRAGSRPMGAGGKVPPREPPAQAAGLPPEHSAVHPGPEGRAGIEINEPYDLLYASRLFRPPRPDAFAPTGAGRSSSQPMARRMPLLGETSPAGIRPR
jgi:hypothetical protein